MRNIFYILFFAVVLVFEVQADVPDREKYDKYFIVDLGAELPSYDELQKHYFDNHSVYNRRYKWHWNIGNVFDAVFRITINEYGGTEKRVKSANEEALMLLLENMPKEYYQYIGPYLHTVPTISEKVLNMPGIKETKNKFPTRIAPQVADIEDIEFLAPYLYFLLMPEAWPENITNLEQPKPKQTKVKSVRNTKLYDTIKKIVPADEFYPNAKTKTTIDKSDFRTIEITQNSPLSSGDIRAFVRTIPELNKIQGDVEAMARIYGAGSLLDVWEQDNELGLPVNSMKDLVSPCSRLLQKMRIAGEEAYLRDVVAKEGFTPEEWAYTCDKTIKAYRMTMLSNSTVKSLKAYALGVYDNYIEEMLGDKAELQFLSVQALLRMHEVSRDDLLQAYKNRKLLRDSFHDAKYSIISAPIAITN